MATKREQLEKLVHEMQALADNCDAKGEFGSEDRERMVKMTTDAKALKDQIKAEADAAGMLSDAKDFLATLGSVDKPDGPQIAGKGGTPPPTVYESLGQAFAESDAYKDFLSRYAVAGGIIPSSVKGIQSQPMQMPGFKGLLSKAVVTGASSTSAGATIRNDMFAGITDLIGERELTVRSLCTQGTTMSDTVEFVRVTAKTNAAAPVPEATTAATPVAPAPAGAEITAGGYKPESGLTLEIVSTTVKTIAHWIPITKRAASDAGQVRTLVDNFLRYGLMEEEEDQILNGSGAGENLTGILTTAGILTVGSAGTDLDAIVDAIRTVRVTGRRRPTGLVIHPNDWFSTGFLLAKDTAGNYLIGDPGASIDDVATLWGLRVVVTEAMTENTALVGDFRQAVIWDREQAAISVSDSHADFFVRNLLAILAEERLAFGVLDPQAFCTVTGV
ncbi:MAG: phage major capsid protein [Chloroflexi bacterium]|nr:phage major capsid protein [Chloroflexota bacterium]